MAPMSADASCLGITRSLGLGKVVVESVFKRVLNKSDGIRSQKPIIATRQILTGTADVSGARPQGRRVASPLPVAVVSAWRPFRAGPTRHRRSQKSVPVGGPGKSFQMGKILDMTLHLDQRFRY
jgi:hypothetical protein